MSDFAYRIKRRITQALTQRRFLGPGPSGQGKVGLVLYFDYEREFGNPAGGESAETGFRSILETLGYHGVKTTWNCVGMIADRYPKTLEKLVSMGQELASHTYSHADVTNLDEEAIVEELAQCKQRFAEKFGGDVVGFHPPRDRWSIRLFKAMDRAGYRYLIARDNNPQHWHAHVVNPPLGGQMLCIPSIADDWRCIEEDCDAETMLLFWLERVAMLKPGHVAAIGFHPWVLGADPSRLRAFASLVDALVANKEISLVTGREVSAFYER